MCYNDYIKKPIGKPELVNENTKYSFNKWGFFGYNKW